MPSRLSILICILLLAVTACTPSPAPVATAVPRQELTISGATSVSSVLAALETQFEAATTGIDLNILSGTTTAAGIQGVLDGVLTAAALLRPLNEEEAAQGVQYATIGQTAVAFIVHPSLDINELTSEQARAIFMGEITNWSQVGGEDAAIVVFARSDSEAHTTLLRTTIFGDAPFPEALVTIAPSHSALLTAIELTPNAIGYTVWGAALASKTQAKPLTLDKVSVTSPDYPILVEMGLGYLTDQQATIQVLLDWLTSDNGRVALAQFGTIQPTNIP